MEKTITTYQQTSDASDLYHERTGDFGFLTFGSADCGNFADYTKNCTFLAPQTIYAPLLIPNQQCINSTKK